MCSLLDESVDLLNYFSVQWTSDLNLVHNSNALLYIMFNFVGFSWAFLSVSDARMNLLLVFFEGVLESRASDIRRNTVAFLFGLFLITERKVSCPSDFYSETWTGHESITYSNWRDVPDSEIMMTSSHDLCNDPVLSVSTLVITVD